MFDIVKQAGLSAAEFGLIVGVSRIAAYNWIKGNTTPHVMVAGRVEQAVKLLKTMVRQKKLPFDAMDRSLRRSEILNIREAVLNSNE